MGASRQKRLWKATLPTDLEAIPAELRALPRWMPWDYFDKGKKKPAKVTLVRHGDYFADSTNPAEWRTFDEAVEEARRRRCGIGFVFSEDDDLCGVDLDSAYDESGKLKPWAAEIAERFSSTWAEKSPSGRGIHFIGRGDKVAGSTKVDHKDREELSEGEAVERYSQKRWFTFSGNVLNAVPVADMRESMAWLDQRFFSTVAKPKSDPNPQPAEPRRDAWDDDHELDVELGRLCLGYLRPDTAANGDEWRRAGMAAKAVGEELKEPWFQFSRLWPEYDDAELEDRWSRFAPASLELGTLIWMATRDSGRSAIDLTNEARRNLGRSESRRERQPATVRADEQATEAMLQAAIPVGNAGTATGIPGLTWEPCGNPAGVRVRMLIVKEGMLVASEAIDLDDRRKRDAYAVGAAAALGENVTPAAVRVELLRILQARRGGDQADGVESKVAEKLLTFSDCVAEWKKHEKRPAITTQFRPLDDVTGGLPCGQLTVFMAEPNAGKTALMLQLVTGAMLYDPALVALWGLGEMTPALIAERMACVGASLSDSEPVTMGDAEHRTRNAEKSLADLERRIAGRLQILPDINIDFIEAAVRRTRAKVLVIDYLQLVTGGPGHDRVSDTDAIMGRIKKLATTENVAIVMASSLPRSVDGESRIGRLGRGSAEIDYGADLVYLGVPDDRVNENGERLVVWKCKKARNGARHDLNTIFDGSIQTFYSAARVQEIPEFASERMATR